MKPRIRKATLRFGYVIWWCVSDDAACWSNTPKDAYLNWVALLAEAG